MGVQLCLLLAMLLLELLDMLHFLAMEREKLMLSQLLMLKLMLMLDTMDTLLQWLFLLQSVLLSQSRSVTRSQSPLQERLAEPSARLLLTSPLLRTVRRPSPLSVSKSLPRLPTALLLLVMTPRLDQLMLLPQLPQLLLDMLVMVSEDTLAGNQFLKRLAHTIFPHKHMYQK